MTVTDTTNPLTRPERAQKMYDGLDDSHQAHWSTTVGNGFTTTEAAGHDMGIAEVVYWWNSIGCAAMNTAVGLDNEPVAILPGTGYCTMWDGLNDAPGSPEGQARQARVLDVGQAILGTRQTRTPGRSVVGHA